MNLKQKIEEWEKTKKEISPWPWNVDYVNEHPTFLNCQRVLSKNPEIEVASILSDGESKNDTYFIASAPENYDAAMQALKEASEIMKVNSTFAEKDEFSPHREWLKKWGFEE